MEPPHVVKQKKAAARGFRYLPEDSAGRELYQGDQVSVKGDLGGRGKTGTYISQISPSGTEVGISDAGGKHIGYYSTSQVTAKVVNLKGPTVGGTQLDPSGNFHERAKTKLPDQKLVKQKGGQFRKIANDGQDHPPAPGGRAIVSKIPGSEKWRVKVDDKVTVHDTKMAAFGAADDHNRKRYSAFLKKVRASTRKRTPSTGGVFGSIPPKEPQ